jgi:hypothetical protein
MELDVIHGTGQAIVAEVTGATVIRLTACTTDLSVVQHTHTRVEQPTDFRLRSFVGCLGRDLHYRAAFNLLRREDAELNTHDRLYVG